MQALKAGTIDALVAQDPYGIGQKAVSLAYQYVTRRKAGIKKHYGTGAAIITRANVNSARIKKFLYTERWAVPTTRTGRGDAARPVRRSASARRSST